MLCNTAQKTVISPNFLVRKFRGNASFAGFWGNYPKLCKNCAFWQNFYTRKLQWFAKYLRETLVFM